MSNLNRFEYRVIIEPCEEGGYFASCPDLPGCHVQAENYETTLSEIHAAIEAHITDHLAAGESLPIKKELATAK